MNEILGNGLVVKHHGEEFVVVEAEGIQHAGSGTGGFGLQFSGYFLPADLLTLVPVKIGGLHLDEIDDAFEIVAQPDGDLQLNGSKIELGLETLDYVDRVRAAAVQL